MKGSSQSPHDKILWALSEHDRKMKRSELRRRTGLRIQEINPILEELEREGWIRIDSKDIISLI